MALAPLAVPRRGGACLRPYFVAAVWVACAVGLFLLGAPGLLAQAPEAPAPPVYRSDLDHSSVAFSVRHFVTPVPGRFRDFVATIRYDRDDPARSSVEFRVRTASITTDNDDRDTHLRSADFFDSGRYPELTFASTSVRVLEPTRFEVTGDLSIRGVIRRVTLPVTLLGLVATPQGEKIGFETAFSLDRRDYGITWNRVLEGAGALLGDEVKVAIAIEALRAPAGRPPG